MKIYRDSKGVYWFNNTSLLQGLYRLDVNEDKSEISIFSINTDITRNLNAIYNVAVTSLLKEDGTPYSGFDEFYFEMSGLFKNKFDGIESGEFTFPVTSLDKAGRAGSNTVFGDTVVGIRKPTISTQFQYGIEEGSAGSTIVSTGGINIIESELIISTGTASDGKAVIYSTDNLRYIPGHESYCYFTAVFTPGVSDSYQRAGIFDDNDGFFVGYEGDTFSFTRRRAGVDYPQTIDIDAFNSKAGEVILGYSLDTSKGNIYKISYGYLGFATITLEVMLPNGTLMVLDSIDYPNTSEVTHITQTFLPIRGEVANTGNTTDITIRSGSLTAGIVDGGNEDISGRNFTWANDASFVFSNNATLVSFRNKGTFNGIDNKVNARLMYASGANDSNKTLKWRLIKNPVFTNPGTATWDDVNTNNSVMEYSTDAIVDIPSSTELYVAWNSGTSADFFNDFEKYSLDLPPNGVASFVILSTATNAEADLSIRWRELF